MLRWRGGKHPCCYILGIQRSARRGESPRLLNGVVCRSSPPPFSSSLPPPATLCGYSTSAAPYQEIITEGNENKNMKGKIKKGDEGDATLRCAICNAVGHESEQCPRNSRQCLNCGEEGHYAASCPHPKLCRKCGKPGHTYRECPDKTKSSILFVGKCYHCGSESHKHFECPESAPPQLNKKQLKVKKNKMLNDALKSKDSVNDLLRAFVMHEEIIDHINKVIIVYKMGQKIVSPLSRGEKEVLNLLYESIGRDVPKLSVKDLVSLSSGIHNIGDDGKELRFGSVLRGLLDTRLASMWEERLVTLPAIIQIMKDFARSNYTSPLYRIVENDLMEEQGYASLMTLRAVDISDLFLIYSHPITTGNARPTRDRKSPFFIDCNAIMNTQGISSKMVKHLTKYLTQLNHNTSNAAAEQLHGLEPYHMATVIHAVAQHIGQGEYIYRMFIERLDRVRDPYVLLACLEPEDLNKLLWAYAKYSGTRESYAGRLFRKVEKELVTEYPLFVRKFSAKPVECHRLLQIYHLGKCYNSNLYSIFLGSEFAAGFFYPATTVNIESYNAMIAYRRNAASGPQSTSFTEKIIDFDPSHDNTKFVKAISRFVDGIVFELNSKARKLGLLRKQGMLLVNLLESMNYTGYFKSEFGDRATKVAVICFLQDSLVPLVRDGTIYQTYTLKVVQKELRDSATQVKSKYDASVPMHLHDEISKVLLSPVKRKQ